MENELKAIKGIIFVIGIIIAYSAMMMIAHLYKDNPLVIIGGGLFLLSMSLIMLMYFVSSYASSV